MKWFLVAFALMACAHVPSARESQADTYRLRISEVTDRLMPQRERMVGRNW